MGNKARIKPNKVKTKIKKLRDMTWAEHKAMTFFEAMPDHLRICIGMKKLDSKGAVQEIIDDSEIGRTLVKMNIMFEAYPIGRKGNVNGK